MDTQELSKLIANISKIQPRDSRDKVKQLLGKPTDEVKLAKKDVNYDWFEWKIKYCIKIWEKGLVNGKYDKSVSLYFDKDDRLTEVASNVDDIASRK